MKAARFLLLLGKAGHGQGAETAIQMAVGQVQGELSQGQLVTVGDVEACCPHLIKTGVWVRSTAVGRKPHQPNPRQAPLNQWPCDCTEWMFLLLFLVLQPRDGASG